MQYSMHVVIKCLPPPLLQVSPNTLEMKLTDLQPDTKYSVRVLAGNSVGYPEGSHMHWSTVRLPPTGGRNTSVPQSTPASLPPPVPMPPVVTLSTHWVGLNSTVGRQGKGSWAIKVGRRPNGGWFHGVYEMFHTCT